MQINNRVKCRLERAIDDKMQAPFLVMVGCDYDDFYHYAEQCTDTELMSLLLGYIDDFLSLDDDSSVMMDLVYMTLIHTLRNVLRNRGIRVLVEGTEV